MVLNCYVVAIAVLCNYCLASEEVDSESIDLTLFGPMIYGRPSEDAGHQVERWLKSNGPGNAEEQGNYFEGDILFPNSMLRNGLKSESHRWPDGVVPVEIENSFCKFMIRRSPANLPSSTNLIHSCSVRGYCENKRRHEGVPHSYLHSVCAADALRHGLPGHSEPQHRLLVQRGSCGRTTRG